MACPARSEVHGLARLHSATPACPHVPNVSVCVFRPSHDRMVSSDLLRFNGFVSGEMGLPVRVALCDALKATSPGDWVLDLGANLGIFSLPLLAWPSGRNVVSIEAQGLVAQMLRASVRHLAETAPAGSVGRSHVVQCALTHPGAAPSLCMQPNSWAIGSRSALASYHIDRSRSAKTNASCRVGGRVRASTIDAELRALRRSEPLLPFADEASAPSSIVNMSSMSAALAGAVDSGADSSTTNGEDSPLSTSTLTTNSEDSPLSTSTLNSTLAGSTPLGLDLADSTSGTRNGGSTSTRGATWPLRLVDQVQQLLDLASEIASTVGLPDPQRTSRRTQHAPTSATRSRPVDDTVERRLSTSGAACSRAAQGGSVCSGPPASRAGHYAGQATKNDARGEAASEQAAPWAARDLSQTFRVVKVDLEGAESEALRGAGVLMASRPPLLFVEARYKADVNYWSALGRELNYTGTQVSQDNWRMVRRGYSGKGAAWLGGEGQRVCTHVHHKLVWLCKPSQGRYGSTLPV